MDNVPVRMIAEQDTPVLPARFNPATKFILVSCYDLGEAVANVMDEREKHIFATYRISGPPSPMDFYGHMQILSNVIGKEVKVERTPLEDLVEGFAGATRQGTDERDAEAITEDAARMLVLS